MPLSELLCWPLVFDAPATLASDTVEFLFNGSFEMGSMTSVAWHPDLVADRLNGMLERTSATASEGQAGASSTFPAAFLPISAAR